jgi:endothelin-converting enzyme/putative endopeptidase
MSKNPLPPDQPIYGRFDELQERNNAILHDILEEASAKSQGADSQKIGDYYASCMDQPAINGKALAPIEPQLDRIAALRDASALAPVLADLHATGVAGFFDFGSGADFKNANEVIAQVDQGGLGLPDRDYYLKDDPKSKELRDQYVQHVTRMLELAGDSHDRASAGSAAVMRIETALAKSSLDRVSRRTPANVYHKMSAADAGALMPAFAWNAYLRGTEAPPIADVNVSVPDFLKAFNALITSTPIDEIRTYLRWHLLNSNAPVLPSAFDEETFAFYGKTLRGTAQQRPRWKRCVDFTNGDLGEALGKVYVERTFGPEGKERTLKMVEAIEHALDKDIQEIAWMSPETKKQAIVKLQAVANKIGYPDRWRDYSTLRIVRGDALGNSQRANTFEFKRQLAKIGKPVDKTEWLMTPPTVNAYYNPLENNINFPAGILQPPFFNKAADEAVNFGAAGAVVGHELTHGFDDQGRQFDPQGNLRDWWTPDDAKAFEQRAACVANQYSGYTAVDDVKVNGRLTLGENVADNGGLRLGWMALMETLASKHLGEADGFTPEQRFFIGWGQMWCENTTPQMARMLAATNPHSPGKDRTNGVVSNFPEFQKAFSCPADAPMINKPICRVW